ncbi:hypothetical protein [Agromyces allii]|uniref:hypothetical protein n=1 Tax=Agromyces allii TaxID=393607 RepID=UPI0012FA99C8|nr:hypothetical protein [Agromyces allii]
MTAETIREPLELLEAAGVIPFIEEWRAEDRSTHPGGRPAAILDTHLLVALLVLVLENAPPHLTLVRDLLAYRLDDDARGMLGVPAAPRDHEDPVAAKNWYNNVCAAYHRLVNVMDPFPQFNRREGTNLQGRIEFRLYRDHEFEATMKSRLDFFSNRLLEASLSAMPREMRRGLKKISITHDQSFIPTGTKRGWRGKVTDRRTRTDKWNGAVVEPELYHFVHSAGARLDEDGKLRTPMSWGAAGNFAVLVPEVDGDPVPHVVMAFSLSEPLKDSDLELVGLLQGLITDRGYSPGHVTGDREFFAGSTIDRLHRAVRQMRWGVVTDLKDDQLGVRGSVKGAILLEGAPYSPGIPAHLRNATIDFRAGRIDEETYFRLIDARSFYRARAKESPNADGAQVHMCPAYGQNAILLCEIRAIHPQSSKKAKRAVHETDLPPAEPILPAICRQTSVTIPADADLKRAQLLQFGSRQWLRTYRNDRNASERFHSIIKDPAHEGVGTRGIRRVRGLAANQVLLAIQLLAANIRIITRFVRKMHLKLVYSVDPIRPKHYSSYGRPYMKPRQAPDDDPEQKRLDRPPPPPPEAE